jgi:hypothetical protein
MDRFHTSGFKFNSHHANIDKVCSAKIYPPFFLAVFSSANIALCSRHPAQLQSGVTPDFLVLLLIMLLIRLLIVMSGMSPVVRLLITLATLRVVLTL